jgi:hypothetical protein
MTSISARFLALTSAASLLFSTPAAARTQMIAYSPWAALSAFAAPASSQALCGVAAATAAGAAASTQGGNPGCVFPALDTPVAPPVIETAPIGTPAAVVAGGGFGVLPLLLSLAALGGLAALLLGNGEGQDQISVSP